MLLCFSFIIFKRTDFMSHQYEIKFMLGALKLMQDKLGGPNASIYIFIKERTTAASEFDYLQ